MFTFKRLALRKIYLQQAADDGAAGGGGADNPPADNPPADDPIAQLRAENEAMRQKMDQLLGETKLAKQKRREAEEAAAREAAEKARKAGDFEQLHRSSEEQRLALQKQLEELQNGIGQEKVKSASAKLSARLADGYDAELLSDYIERRLRFADGDIKVMNNKGELTVSSLDNLHDEIKADPRFKKLLRGSAASGGGATGNNSGNATTKTLTRSEFDALSHSARTAFFKSGGKLT